MDKVQEALKSAIEALEIGAESFGANNIYIKPLNLCKAALAEIEKCEPVALADEHIISTISIEMIKELETRSGNKFPYHLWTTKLYTSPISKEWVSLTNDEIQREYLAIQSHRYVEFARLIEAKLKQLNAPKE